VLGQAWVNESVSILFLALAAGSILYVVIELLNAGRVLASKALVTCGILIGLVLGFATDFVLIASGV
jgi:ZIP family zinc transporter